MSEQQPIKSPYQLIMDILEAALPKGEKHSEIATAVVALIEEKKLYKYVTGESLIDTLKNEFNGFAFVRLTNVPEVDTVVFMEATTSNVAKHSELLRVESKVLQLKAFLDEATGKDTVVTQSLENVAKAMLNL